MQADAQSYAFDREVFDVAISRFGVMFFENPVKAFQNIKSAIQPGREMRFVCWAPIAANDFFILHLKLSLISPEYLFPNQVGNLVLLHLAIVLISLLFYRKLSFHL